MMRKLSAPTALVLCLIALSCAPKEMLAVEKMPPPAHLPKDGKWVPIPELCDEFGGKTLDAGKWHDHNPGWKGRQPGWFHTGNVAVRDGMLHLTMKHETLPNLPKGYHTYTSAAVKSRAKVRYGYFEIRCRAMNSKGSSAFWFYDGTPEIWTEIDVFEMGAGNPKHRHAVHMNVHVFHTLVNPDRHWADAKRWDAPWLPAEGFHVYGLDWGPDELRFLIDGKCLRTTKNTHWHQPLTLNFDSETMPKWFGLPEPDTLPSTFSIDYVRSWKKVDPEAESRPRACTIRFPKAKDVAGKRKVYRLATDGDGALLVICRFNGAGQPGRIHIEYDDAAFFKAQTAKTIFKRVAVTDTRGRKVVLAFRWSKQKAEKRNNGYRADWVDVEPDTRPKTGEQIHEFAADGGEMVRMTLSY